jgi:hypothetical protein
MDQIVLGDNSGPISTLTVHRPEADASPAVPACASTPTRPSPPASLYDLTTLERFTLLVLQQARNGITESDLWFITGAETVDVGKALTTLEGLKLIEHLGDGAAVRYIPVALSSVPLFVGWESWLTAYCAKYPQVCDGDTRGTTYGTVMVVILVALLSGSRNRKLIADLTTLPPQFVSSVLEMIDVAEKWCFVELYELEKLLLEKSEKHFEILHALQALMERLWNRWWTPEREIALNRLRAGRQVGGQADTWVDDGECVKEFISLYSAAQ